MTTDPFAMDGPINEQGQEQMDDDTADRHRASVEAADVTERERASRYLDALGEEEDSRRRQINYTEQYSVPHSWGDKEPAAIGECPVCSNTSLVGSYCDGEQVEEAIIGHCIVCSYERTSDVAQLAADDVQYQRAVDRD